MSAALKKVDFFFKSLFPAKIRLCIVITAILYHIAYQLKIRRYFLLFHFLAEQVAAQPAEVICRIMPSFWSSNHQGGQADFPGRKFSSMNCFLISKKF